MKKFLNKSLIENQNFIVGLLVGIIITCVGLYIFQFLNNTNLSIDKAGAKSIEYINSEILKGQATATLEDITVESKDLYKLKIKINDAPTGQDSYITKDGQYFFPSSFKMSSTTATTTPATINKTGPTATTKSDKPEVDLFVMSYCPFGTQIEKGILPVVQALGDKINFNLKFVNYAMHGEKELTENLIQHCIQKDQNSKLLPYLSCFLKSDDSTSCLESTKVDQAQLNSCVKNTDQQFKVTEQFTNKQNWKGDFPPFDIDGVDNIKYKVQGSPTLVINGSQVESARDSASLLNTICGAFNNKPEACSTKLSATAPAPGFGDGKAPTGGSANADCATN